MNKDLFKQKNSYKNSQKMYLEIDRHKTNHVLHLILSIVTMGIWIWGWCMNHSLQISIG